MAERRNKGLLGRAFAQSSLLLERLGAVKSTVLLTGLCVIGAVAFHTMIGHALFSGVTSEVLLSAVLVTLLVAPPLILYSQILLRRLSSSRRVQKQMTERLALALDNAEAANLSQARFLANMSHELRTPLNAILGFSESMMTQTLGPVGNPRYLEYVRDIHASGSHLLEVINDILDLSKIESGSVGPENFEACEIHDVVKDAMRIVRPLADKQRVSLQLSEGETGTRLVIAERMVRQVLINVLSNAVKFTPPGGSVTVQHGPIAGGYRASVLDTGVGMTREQTKIALSLFGQVRNPLSEQNKGTGLGLPLSKAIMEMHGGGLSLESVPARGTKVELLFPAERLAPDQPRLSSSAA